MAKRKIETRGHITGFKEAIDKAAATDEDAFFGWFDNRSGFEETQRQAAWDFSWHFATPLAPYLRAFTGTETALEIGCGGGRLLAQASRHFAKVIGVDIHNNLDIVARKFTELGITNAELRQGDGLSLPCTDASVDVVYSFIVFLHLEKIDILERNIAETSRILKKDGLAMLYTGRYRETPLDEGSKLRYLKDLIMENIKLSGGFREMPAPVNSANLLVTRNFMKRIAARHGLQFVACMPSGKSVPRGTRLYGGQHGFLFRRA